MSATLIFIQAIVNLTAALLQRPFVEVSHRVVSLVRGTSTVEVHWFARAVLVNVPYAYPIPMRPTRSWFEVIRAISIVAVAPMKPFVKMGAADNVSKMRIATEVPAN